MQNKNKNFSIDEYFDLRKSVRNFNNKKVNKRLIKEIVRAGIKAPSGGNFQPWFFVVIQDEEKIRKIRKIIKDEIIKKIGSSNFYKDDFVPLFNAKTIIFVCVDMSYTYLNSECKNDLDKALDSVEIISVGACIENMLLKISSLGLGACWCRVNYYYREKVENFLKIKKPYFLIASIVLGYSAEKKIKTSRKDLDSVFKFLG